MVYPETDTMSFWKLVGMGVLTKYLLDKEQETFVAEIDQESVAYLKLHYPKLENHILNDFLKLDIPQHFDGQVAVIGNFPYNISSQILFKIIDNYERIPEMTGMFQKEVAERTAAVPRTKDYGILSVMVQAYYDVKYLLLYMKMSLIPTKGKVRSYKSCKKS